MQSWANMLHQEIAKEWREPMYGVAKIILGCPWKLLWAGGIPKPIVTHDSPEGATLAKVIALLCLDSLGPV